jgi:hypothetical protein
MKYNKIISIFANYQTCVTLALHISIDTWRAIIGVNPDPSVNSELITINMDLLVNTLQNLSKAVSDFV